MVFFRRNACAGSEGGGSGPSGTGNGTADGDDTSEPGDARVLRFDPSVRERRKRPGATSKGTLGRRGAMAGSGSESLSPNAASRVKDSHTFRFRVFKAIQIAGVLFALVLVVRSCG